MFWIYLFIPIILVIRLALFILRILQLAFTPCIWITCVRRILAEMACTFNFGCWFLKMSFLATYHTLLYPLTWPLRIFLVYLRLMIYSSNAPKFKGHDNQMKDGATREYRWIVKQRT